MSGWMDNLHLQLNDDLYKNIATQTKISVSTEEAKQKVTNAVERYRDGTGTYTTLNPKHVEEMNKYIESI
ncbi:hypothetical protein [Sulfuricurvum sp.]|uniref:hypothetical protein n=1 Tax=Sulfuricurvum sp. TaxID=2025608 RepID=UPI002E3802CC|nr:hypothetical protein [Sulfuricurvum sp.]HEX5329642.1 hypothetical protein [Sulfuricurvum sp.]